MPLLPGAMERRGKEDYMLKELILEGQNRYFDSEPCQGLKVTAKDSKKLCREMKEMALKNTWNDRDRSALNCVILRLPMLLLI